MFSVQANSENNKENQSSTDRHPSKVVSKPDSRKPLQSLGCHYNLRSKPLQSLGCHYNLRSRKEEPQIRNKEFQKNPGKRRRSKSADDIDKLIVKKPEVRIKVPIVEKEKLRKDPAIKPNLARKLSHRSSTSHQKKSHQKNQEEDLYAECLFDDDYMEDNYKYLLKYEDRFIFKRDVLESRIGYKERQALIDWTVQFVALSKLDESTMFSAVRMFDKLLYLTDLHKERFEIAMLACLLIASKFNSSGNHLFCLKSNPVFDSPIRKYQTLIYEQKIIKILDFQLNFPEPAIFLAYFLKKHCLAPNKTIRCTAMFLLEYFATLPLFSSSAPSLLAGAALYLALRKLQMKQQADVLKEFIANHLLDEDSFRRYASTMYYNVKQALQCKDTYGGICSKYATDDKMRVSYNF